MSAPTIVTIVLLVILIIMGILYFAGSKMQKKQMAQKDQIREAAQQTSMLIIDKKVMKLKEAGLPKMVLEQTPKRYHNTKMPIVKAKIGPQTMNLICDEGIFDELPTKCEVKAMVSGIYLLEIKSVRGKKKNQVAEQPKKKGFGAKMRARQRQLQDEYEQEERLKAAKKVSKEEEKKKKERAKKITQ